MSGATWLRVDVDRGGPATPLIAPSLLNVAHIAAVEALGTGDPRATVSLVRGATLRVDATVDLIQAAIEHGDGVVNLTAAGQAKRREAALKAAELRNFAEGVYAHSTTSAKWGAAAQNSDVVVIVYDNLGMPQHFRGLGTITPPTDDELSMPAPWYQRPVRVRFSERTYDLILPAAVVFPADAVPPLG